MQAIQSPSLADGVRTLPAGGAARSRQLYRLIDLHAAAEASTALGATEKGDDVLAVVLTAAAAVLADRASADDAARDRLRDAAWSSAFLSLVPDLVRELRETAAARPEAGACTVASALELWAWTMKHLRAREDVTTSQSIDDLAFALSPLIAARCLALDVARRDDDEVRRDLSHVYAARAAATAGAACAELVFGHRRHQVWDASGCASCFGTAELDGLDALIPGISGGAGVSLDVIGADGKHPGKEGPCVRFDGVETFMQLRNRLDGCLTGARIARDRAASAIARAATNTTSKGRA